MTQRDRPPGQRYDVTFAGAAEALDRDTAARLARSISHLIGEYDLETLSIKVQPAVDPFHAGDDEEE